MYAIVTLHNDVGTQHSRTPPNALRRQIASTQLELRRCCLPPPTTNHQDKGRGKMYACHLVYL